LDIGLRGRRFFMTTALPAKLAEVHDHVGALGRREHDLIDRNRDIEQPAFGADLPERRTADVETENARVAAVEDAQPVHPWLDIEIGPDLAVDEHDIAEVLADPRRADDVAARIKKGAVGVELPVLDDQWDLVRSARNADGIRLGAGVELIADDVGRGEAGEDVEARRAEGVIVEPEQRGRHLRRLVGIQHGLRLADSEAKRRRCGAAIAVGGNEAAMQMGHEADLITERRQTCVYRQPVGIRGRECMLESHGQRRATLGDDGHAKRAGLIGKPRAVVVGPDRRRGQMRMKLPPDLALRECIGIHAAGRRYDDTRAWTRYWLQILRELPACNGAGMRCSNGPR